MSAAAAAVTAAAAAAAAAATVVVAGAATVVAPVVAAVVAAVVEADQRPLSELFLPLTWHTKAGGWTAMHLQQVGKWLENEGLFGFTQWFAAAGSRLTLSGRSDC